MAGGYAGIFAKCELEGQERPKFCDDDEDLVISQDRLAGDEIIPMAWIYEEDGWRRIPNMSFARIYHQCSLIQKNESNVSTGTMLQKLSKCEVKATLC